MRITNPMMTNRMLLNMNRNATRVDTLYNQIATGKKITFPSDNPLIASRALKFRTNVSETEQYMKNVAQGMSWMEVSEAAFKNIHTIIDKIRDLAERGATGTLTFEDRQKIITEIASLTDQIGLEMNATYAGRYIFSGYRTNESPTVTENDPDMKYRLTQYFTADDVETTKSYIQCIPPAYNPGDSIVNDIKVIKLAYKDLPDGAFISPAVNVVSMNPGDPDYPLGGPADIYVTGNYIKETGEFIVDDGTTSITIPAYPSSFAITYEKEGFLKGELNPKIYFDCFDLTGFVPFPPGPTTALTNAQLMAQGIKQYNAGFSNQPPQRQELELEFSIGTRIKINSAAGDIFTDKMYGDLQSLVQILTYANGKTKDQIRTELESWGLTGEELEDHLALETQKIQDMLQSRFRNMIALADLHMNRISREHTDMGTRMSRLELIETRLSDDRVSYTKLLSENEDTDYMEALMNLNIAESVYQASLHAGANIMKITLADYI